MTTITINPKHEIVRSLNDLDAVQSVKVLDFIKTLRDSQEDAASQQDFKRRFVKEMNQALSQVRLWI
jgi:hypothetical protein